MTREQQPFWIVAQLLRATPESTRQMVATDLNLSSTNWEAELIPMLEEIAQRLVLSKYNHGVGDLLQAANYLKFQDIPRRKIFGLISWVIEHGEIEIDYLPSIEEAAEHIMNVLTFWLICAVKSKKYDQIAALTLEIKSLNGFFFLDV